MVTVSLFNIHFSSWKDRETQTGFSSKRKLIKHQRTWISCNSHSEHDELYLASAPVTKRELTLSGNMLSSRINNLIVTGTPKQFPTGGMSPVLVAADIHLPDDCGDTGHWVWADMRSWRHRAQLSMKRGYRSRSENNGLEAWQVNLGGNREPYTIYDPCSIWMCIRLSCDWCHVMWGPRRARGRVTHV